MQLIVYIFFFITAGINLHDDNYTQLLKLYEISFYPSPRLKDYKILLLYFDNTNL